MDVLSELGLKECQLAGIRFSASNFDRLSSPKWNEIVRIFGAWFSASAPNYNIEAFISAGLVPVERGEVFYLEVQPQKARRVRQ
jgi:hypothetical protein